jgi:hypothetical protein
MSRPGPPWLERSGSARLQGDTANIKQNTTNAGFFKG